MAGTARTRASAAGASSRSDLLDVAADVARRLLDFDEYGSVDRARRALRRRRPGLTDGRYARALDKATALHGVARELVAARAPELWRRRDHGPDSLGEGLRDVARGLRRSAPGFGGATYEWIAGWVWYWYHLR